MLKNNRWSDFGLNNTGCYQSSLLSKKQVLHLLRDYKAIQPA